MNIKTGINMILALALSILSTFTVADTVTAVRAPMTFYAGNMEPVYVQLASAPGIWIGTHRNTSISAVLEMALRTNPDYLDVSHEYDDAYGAQEIWRVYAQDNSANGIANRIYNFFVFANDVNGPNNSMLLQLGNFSGCITTTPEQAGLAAKALFNKIPITVMARQSWIYDATQNTVVQINACTSLRLNS